MFTARLNSIVLGCWVLAALRMIQDDRYQNFLRPDFFFLVIISFVMLMVFFATVTAVSKPHEEGLRNKIEMWVKAGILLVPIAFMASAEGSVMGSYAFNRKFITPVVLVPREMENEGSVYV
jgi:hypothetical protein